MVGPWVFCSFFIFYQNAKARTFSIYLFLSSCWCCTNAICFRSIDLASFSFSESRCILFKQNSFVISFLGVTSDSHDSVLFSTELCLKY